MKLDYLVMNAGIVQRESFESTSLDVFSEIMDINFYSCVTMTHAVLPHMQANGGGAIIATSSVFGLHGAPNRTAYAASKHALNGFLNSLRPEIAQYNISTSLVCPGLIATNISYTARLGDGSFFQKDTNSAGMHPRDCARQFTQIIYNKEPRKVVGSLTEKVRVMASRLSSNLEAEVTRRLAILLKV